MEYTPGEGLSGPPYHQVYYICLTKPKYTHYTLVRKTTYLGFSCKYIHICMHVQTVKVYLIYYGGGTGNSGSAPHYNQNVHTIDKCQCTLNTQLTVNTDIHTYIRTHVPKGSHSHELIFCFSHFVTSQQTTVEKT